ncbi:hypothetical protein [Opitutus terrae]|uniref:Uncharacterized protein n=1 Tax=Opitutus terrae (strain DSM 11246 / JCM 15787 / PB90-1) TaxID=452637 RepID=B1ZUB3_OPITP|nr:hypothetical protein [Opitutus terrae]ACB76675.1 hypothetical protein Oter_3398 [Opitutus terrae PB90-1]
MDAPLARPSAIEIRIANVDLPTKLDALGAALAAIREAHRDDMSVQSWAALHRAQEAIAEAIIYANVRKPVHTLPAIE